MRPKIELLSQKAVDQILGEAFGLLENPGVLIDNQEAQNLLQDAGAELDSSTGIVKIPEAIVREALNFCPKEFSLYTLHGDKAVDYRGDQVHFDPGSAALTILDRETQRPRPPATADFVSFVKLVEMLPQLDAQSTAMVCADVVEEIGDLYRLYLALLFMNKPIITGAFRIDTWQYMKELLTAAAGGEDALQKRPLAVFDVCPSPPLKWSNLTCQNMIDCARSGIPSQMVSMPLAGATAPVTLAGAVTQHAAECLSGITISQLANQGAPIIWGGSPAVFDMRESTTPMGAVGTWMIDAAYTQVGKALQMPTHAYLGLSDSKAVDAQAGLESAGGAFVAMLSGVNMISGAGMLAFENCQSFEKLVIDAEIIGMAKHFQKGIQLRESPIATDLIREVGHKSEFIIHDHTARWFREEFYLPSPIIDRQTEEDWLRTGALTSLDRAKQQVDNLITSYPGPSLSEQLQKALREITATAARQFGMDALPPLP